MAREPASGAGQDGEAVLPGAVTPDWVSDEDWALICASRGLDEDDPGDGWDAWAPGAEDGPPPDWASVRVEEIAVQAEAEGAGHVALMARLLAAGVGDGYAHLRGEPPVPGVFTGPAAGFGQARCLDGALPESALSMLADEASGADPGLGRRGRPQIRHHVVPDDHRSAGPAACSRVRAAAAARAGQAGAAGWRGQGRPGLQPRR